MPAPPSTRVRGQLAEDQAARFLEARGLLVVDRNVRAGGVELDLVGLVPAGVDDRVDTYVFVEVRSREDDRAGLPEETVDPRKQARLRRGAAAWLVGRDLWETVAVRFNVVSVLIAASGDSDDPRTKAPRITWIPGAFEADRTP
ncbi:YraN family protein [Nannocystis pusilla]|uniref:YraN family protein n=1 Tax=Nannocystis pusilla TaxID=889268 RepID=UPI003DA50385